MDMAKLKIELAKPAYTALSDEEAAKVFAISDRTVDREAIEAGLIVGAINWAEYDAVTVTEKQRDHLRLIISAGSVFVTPELRRELRDTFPQGTATRTNLRAILQRNGNRAEEAGLGSVPTPSEIADARRLP